MYPFPFIEIIASAVVRSQEYICAENVQSNNKRALQQHM